MRGRHETFTLTCIDPAPLNSDQLPSCEIDGRSISRPARCRIEISQIMVVTARNVLSCFESVLKTRAQNWPIQMWRRVRIATSSTIIPGEGAQRRRPGTQGLRATVRLAPGFRHTRFARVRNDSQAWRDLFAASQRLPGGGPAVQIGGPETLFAGGRGA